MGKRDKNSSTHPRREQQHFSDGTKAERPGPFDVWQTDHGPRSMAGKFCKQQNRFFRDLVTDMVAP